MPAQRAARDAEYREAVQEQVKNLLRDKPYHSLQLPDGTLISGLIPIEALAHRIQSFPIPATLDGKKVLDVGAASGWNSFEMLRRGAAVTAVDCVEFKELTAVRRFFPELADYKILDVDEFTRESVGVFDYVLFFGVLYHLRHPLLALENICSLTMETAFVESFVSDPVGTEIDSCSMEFYETDELGGQIDNWVGPTVKCLLALCRSAGFVRVHLEYVSDRRAGLTCHRRWEAEPENATLPPAWVYSAVNNRTNDIYFHPAKDEYLCIYFRASETHLTPGQMRVEVDGWGVNALTVTRLKDDEWQLNSRLPPGLLPGDHTVRLRTEATRFGNEFVVTVVDSAANVANSVRASLASPAVHPHEAGAPQIFAVENSLDGSAIFYLYSTERLCCRFRTNEMGLVRSAVFACVDDEEVPHQIHFLTDLANGAWQVTFAVPATLAPGTHAVRIRTASSGWSEPAEFLVHGAGVP